MGIYKGLSQQELDGQLKDYLTIEYANKDRLHIPAEQINLLCRYRGSGASKPKLSRMGGNDWEKTKTKVKKAVETIAYDLLKLYARRKMQQGIAFSPDTTLSPSFNPIGANIYAFSPSSYCCFISSSE